jgi:hypothetical protein
MYINPQVYYSSTIQNILNFQQIQEHNGTKPSKYKNALP